MHPITIHYTFRSKERSLATGQVADLFGLAAEELPHVVADDVRLDIRPGDLVLFTGPSGSGKSSLLRAAGGQLGALDADAQTLPDRPLVDCLDGPVAERLDRLAACGLSEARLLLRTPAELSDGQRYRFRLAYALDQLQPLFTTHRSRTSPELEDSPRGLGTQHFLLADEFAANLDRTLAKVVAFNVRKLCARTGVGFLLATTHEDLLDDLNPDVWVRCHGDGFIECVRHPRRLEDSPVGLKVTARHPRRLEDSPAGLKVTPPALGDRDVKKKRSHSPTIFGCRQAPVPTGRTSLGGIIAVITLPTPGGSSCSGTGPSRSAFVSSARRPRR